MTDAELRQLALDIVEGRVIGTWTMQETPEQVTQVFPIVSLMDDAGIERLRSYAHIYQYLSEAGPWAMNGKPMFFSFRSLSLADWDALRPLVLELSEQRRAFLSPEPEPC